MSKETTVSISFDPSAMETCPSNAGGVETIVAGAGFVMTQSSLAGTVYVLRSLRGAPETRAEARARNVATEKMPFMMCFV